jgi:ribose/xylose/arabinose/galactoside ABC-type transport system permease subunit
VLLVGLSFRYPHFHSHANLFNILLNVSQVSIVGIGMTLVILTAGIDVSVGSALGVCAVVVGYITLAGMPLPVALVAGIATGAAIGLGNGALIALGRVHPIIITLGTLNILRLISFQLLHGQWLTGIPPTLAYLGHGSLGGLPVAWWMAMALAGAVTFYLGWRRSGRHLYAIGGDAETARLAGVNVRLRTLSVYVMTGALVGLASAIFVGGQGVVQSNVGVGFELQVIAAVVIGGTSILGGKGSVVGTLLGALLVGVIRNALVVADVPPLLEGLVLGVLIIIAVALDVFRRRKESR